MRAVIQRVNHANVLINQSIARSINKGLVVLLGIETNDNSSDAEWLAAKIARMRIFSDAEALMNLSVVDVKGEVMVISQFTLHAITKKGNRPSFILAAKREQAIPLYALFIGLLEKELNKKIVTGEFGADMQVTLTNDGPVTIIIDTK